jgi:6-phosphogluconolactonase (cycloisomerase 2 family)
MTKRLTVVLALAAVVAVPALMKRDRAFADGRGSFFGAVYTMSNAGDGNAVLTFLRLPNGRLLRAGATPTGGNGTGSGLGNQGGLVLTQNERWLLAVNAGSDTVTVFEVGHLGLRRRDVQPSGGSQPISIATHRNLVYVLNALSDSIAGFRLSRHGTLHPIPGSIRSLSASGVGPAQISFTPDGDVLVVTEKNTNRIVTFPLDRDGGVADIRVHPSSGETPFGFAFGKRNQLFVSEAFGGTLDASAVSSYRIDEEGGLETISASVGTTETAACWVAVSPNGRFAYVTNTGSGSVSAYAVDFDGTIELVGDGRAGVTGDGSMPIDLAITDNGRFLYTLNSGTHAIGVFFIRHDGGLTPLRFVSGLPESANGMAAR